MPSIAASTARAAVALGMSADSATWSTNSLLFNVLPLACRVRRFAD